MGTPTNIQNAAWLKAGAQFKLVNNTTLRPYGRTYTVKKVLGESRGVRILFTEHGTLNIAVNEPVWLEATQ